MSQNCCPVCHGKIPTNSKLCPQCNATPPPTRRGNGKKSARKTGAAFLGFAVLLLAIGAAWAFFAAESAEIPPATAVEICGTAFVKAAEAETDFTYMSVVLWDLGDSWLVKFPAKVRATAGAWDEVVVHCRCLKKNPDPANELNLEALVEFQIVPTS